MLFEQLLWIYKEIDMQRNILETLTGFLVLLVALGCVLYAYWRTENRVGEGHYNLIAKFEHVDGLNPGSEVKIAGVKVGTITKSFLDPKTYLAVVEFSIKNSVKLPEDSSAQIVGEGLLGGKYLSIAPGADDKMLSNGREIHYTQSSVSIESLIGKMIFSNATKGNSNQ
jgi:phospholipid/cholesterol/gamma-HCH transport system substrate-binding protein